jgi:hypothetical protein
LGQSAKGFVDIEEEKSADRFQAKYSKRTPTWLVSRDKIEALIEEIKAEVAKNLRSISVGINRFFLNRLK